MLYFFLEELPYFLLNTKNGETILIKKEQNLPPQNILLYYKDFFRLIIFKKCRHSRSSENRVDITLGKETCIYKEKSPFVRMSPRLYQEEECDQVSINYYQ